MYIVKQKLKWCKESFIKWRKTKNCNAKKNIELIKKEMETMQKLGGNRNWEK